MSDPEATAAVLVNHYAKRWIIEPGFRDTNALRFGIRLLSTRIGAPTRRDRLLLVISNMPEHRLNPLMAAFEKGVSQASALSDFFAHPV